MRPRTWSPKTETWPITASAVHFGTRYVPVAAPQELLTVESPKITICVALLDYAAIRFGPELLRRFTYDRLAASARRTTFASSGVKLVSPASMCPVSRAVTSWNTQPLPSGSLNEAYEA